MQRDWHTVGTQQMMASISPVPTKPSSCLPFAPSREKEMKGVLLVVGGYPSRPLGLCK